MKLSKMVENKLSQWDREAESAFCLHGQVGGTFERQLWANGQTMVHIIGEWATIKHAIPLNRAIEIYQNGYRIPA